MPQTITVAAGMVSSGLVTLAANEVATVQFAGDMSGVEILSDGSADVWYRTDGTPAVVGDKSCWRMPVGFATCDTRRNMQPWRQPCVVSLVSTGTPTVTVQRG